LTRALIAALALALTFARPSASRAEGPRPQTRPTPAQPTKAQARAVYAKGKAAYERGEYAVALAHFEEAYRLSPAAALLFNMAQAHRLSGPEHCQQALDLYRRYVAADPEAKNREEAAERIDEMQKCVARPDNPKSAASPAIIEPARAADARPPSVERAHPSQLSAPPPARPARDAPAAPPPRARSAAPIIVTGVSAAVGIAGVILYARARAKYDEVESTCPCQPGAFSNWETLTSVSYGLMAVGAVGTASGVSWYLLGGDNGSNAPHGFLIRGSARF
jgi:tetratricopeptide (TPR) repeat protein